MTKTFTMILKVYCLISIQWSDQWQTGVCLVKHVLQFIFAATNGTLQLLDKTSNGLKTPEPFYTDALQFKSLLE